MEEKKVKSNASIYIKGLLIRIIIACTLFILLFLAGIFSVNIMGYDTTTVTQMVEDNTLIESIRKKLK